MGFQEEYGKLHAHYKKALAKPCEDPTDQATRDRLTRHDRLHQQEGHTIMCACQQVFGGKPCSCSTKLKEEHPA